MCVCVCVCVCAQSRLFRKGLAIVSPPYFLYIFQEKFVSFYILFY